MRHLKTYEDYKDLTLNYEKSVKPDDIKNIISKYCKDFKWTDKPIYRGFWGEGDAVIIDPRDQERFSANTRNYYTWIIDNSPAYKDYPKRSRSLICTDDIGTARTFGDDIAWRVIPFDGAKIGVCSSLDLWVSFPNIKKTFNDDYISLDDFNSNLETLYSALYGEWEEGKFGKRQTKGSNMGGSNNAKKFFNNLETLLDDLSILEDENNLEELKKNHPYPHWVDIDFAKRLPKTVKEVIDLFDPNKNGIELFDYKEWLKKDPVDREVWISHPCLLVKESLVF